ncbi:inverse autotransporter beta domain-containing protein [Oceanimonas sp. CHS3-5]|uniref:inverse autotransporter beta domain-containing protein n=1 Tax=Oceanimonas sp. CHS3-5 TaxID=3068186 RepID=UPI00273E4483|nr:inverse autotransporter beta domain-containing protein [Oceanimonas sp. CHS3-5]MDP5293720.1 inverse autotransporter beta domain-containing protein [Oceanimonas sp. CHS3-5]
MRWVCLLLGLGMMAMARAAGPVMVMHQVSEGENWAGLAQRYQLTERTLRWEFNRERFMVPLAPDDWIWVPERVPEQVPERVPEQVPARVPERVSDKPPSSAVAGPVPARLSSSAAPATSAAHASTMSLPGLGRPDPARAPRSGELLQTLASAARAAATDDLDGFVLAQTELLADDTLSFGTSRLASLPWLNPSDWYWDYQLPLFDQDAEVNSQLALPVWKALNTELGVDYRDDRLTYQLGLHYRQPLASDRLLHIEPLFDYQEHSAHRRGGLLLWLEQNDWRLGAAQYRPLSPWRLEQRRERPAAGRIWFGEGRVKALPGLSVSGRHYRWRGEQLRLFGSGDRHKAAASTQWSLNYAPWRILRLQTSLLSNSENEVESRLRLMLELPLRLAPGLWWRMASTSGELGYRPLQYHRVMVLEQR